MTKVGLKTAATICLWMAAAASLHAGTWDVVARTRQFLDSYARDDRASVLAQIDPSIVVYGSDAAEIFHGPKEVETMLANDQKLWGGAAQIGAMEDVSVIQSRDVATIFFDAGFSVGGRPPVPVRFAMTWKRFGRKWMLVQSSNVGPTQGQSAAELLGGAAQKPD